MSRAAGIPDDQQGCRLSMIDGYAASGHVPIGTIRKLLPERPDIKGVTLPGMPAWAAKRKRRSKFWRSRNPAASRASTLRSNRPQRAADTFRKSDGDMPASLRNDLLKALSDPKPLSMATLMTLASSLTSSACA